MQYNYLLYFTKNYKYRITTQMLILNNFIIKLFCLQFKIKEILNFYRILPIIKL